jgi:branched-chain amino acid transport system permease protein
MSVSKVFRQSAPFLALVLVWLVLLAAHSGYAYRVATTTAIFCLLAASANLVTGVAGLMTLGHAAFYGLGAYAAALGANYWGISPLLTLPLAGLVAATVGLLVAWVTRRLVSIHFAVATLGIGQAIYVTLLNWVDFTRGPMGVTDIPPLGLSSDAGNLALVLAITAVLLWGLFLVFHSYFGNALRALREDERCVAAMGLSPGKLKIQAMTLSCFCAGVAGALWAHTTRYVSPNDFRFSESIAILSMVVVGGLGSLPGAIVGAILLTVLPELLRPIGDYRMLVVGGVMFASILFLPRGLLGEVSAIKLVRRHFNWQEQR